MSAHADHCWRETRLDCSRSRSKPPQCVCARNKQELHVFKTPSTPSTVPTAGIAISLLRGLPATALASHYDSGCSFLKTIFSFHLRCAPLRCAPSLRAFAPPLCTPRNTNSAYSSSYKTNGWCVGLGSGVPGGSAPSFFCRLSSASSPHWRSINLSFSSAVKLARALAHRNCCDLSCFRRT